MHTAVIIPAFNVAPWLRDCLLSLLSQTCRDWTAFVVDDGSTDRTPEIAQSVLDPRIHLIRQQNAGVSSARNAGLSVALSYRPDALLFLDADDWLAPDALARLTDLLAASPWAVAASGANAHVDMGGRVRRVAAPAAGCLLERLLRRNLFVNGGQLLLRREAVEEAGGFNTRLGFGEDWEYWVRLALLGEFVGLRSAPPVLFARERPGSAYRGMATDPGHNKIVMDAIYALPSLAERLGTKRLAALRNRAEAECAWTLGRELIRHGRVRDGREWLAKSLRVAPKPRRMLLLILSLLRAGPFRPYSLPA